MLDVKLGREGPPPRDAATVLCIRDGASGLEVLCVERAKASQFLGGAIVFPGGKLDPADRDPRASQGASTPDPAATAFAPDADTARALAVAACRECFEEAGLLFTDDTSLTEQDRREMRVSLTQGISFPDLVETHGFTLDLAGLVPFARWVTPVVETRRFDTRFYLVTAPPNQAAIHDAHETTSAFWGTPREVLARFERGECQLFPPTHRSLEILAEASSVADAIARARKTSLDEICPELVKQPDVAGDTMALVLPGDREHSIRETRAPGRSRYVLRGERWLPEDAPP